MNTIIQKLNWSYCVNKYWVRNLFRILLGLNLLFVGISHLNFFRVEFAAVVPNWLPLSNDLTVILSGIAEIIIGLALMVLPKWKALIGWVAALFFVIVFPGNIVQYLNQVDAFVLDTDHARFIRLFFQPVFVAWALW